MSGFATNLDEVSRPTSLHEVQRATESLGRVLRADLRPRDVADRQILSALIRECGLGFVNKDTEKFLYAILQSVANEARQRGLLHNVQGAQLYSTAVGNARQMRPSLRGWEQTKGILSRKLYLGKIVLQGLERAYRRMDVDLRHGQSSRGPRRHPPVRGR